MAVHVITLLHYDPLTPVADACLLQARYTMKINGANSVYGLWAPANTDYVFLRGWPVLWTITVRSSNGGSIKNKRVQLAPDNQLNCVNTDEYTNDKGVVTIRCTFDQGLLIPAASITVMECTHAVHACVEKNHRAHANWCIGWVPLLLVCR